MHLSRLLPFVSVLFFIAGGTSCGASDRLGRSLDRADRKFKEATRRESYSCKADLPWDFGVDSLEANYGRSAYGLKLYSVSVTRTIDSDETILVTQIKSKSTINFSVPLGGRWSIQFDVPGGTANLLEKNEEGDFVESPIEVFCEWKEKERDEEDEA